MMKQSYRTELLSARLPRYTSYPPADRFSAAIGPADKAAWLAAHPAGAPLSLYVHVPFCARLCWFCACRTQGTRSVEPLDRYLDHLETEIAATRAVLPDDAPLSGLHLGGGTPTILDPSRLARLGRLVSRHFVRAGGAEIAAEIDPTECDAARLDALAAMGLTRASIGVQDVDPMVQAAIGRIQTPEATRATAEGLRARGIASLNFDLLYGLPHQTPARLARTLDTVLALGPDRIALYGYAHVPWVARRQRLIPAEALPDPAARLDLADRARGRLIGAGYAPVGIDHFARPDDDMARAARRGTLRRSFQGYTTDTADTLVGLGPSAVSRFAQGYVQNAAASRDWQRLVAGGQLPAARGIALGADEARTGRLIERLMCDGVADLAAISGPDRARHRAEIASALARWPDAGTLDGDVVRLSDMAAARLICSRLDRGLDRQADRYSHAS